MAAGGLGLALALGGVWYALAGRPGDGPHDEEVLGFTRLGADVSLADARTESDVACGREVSPGDYGFDPSVYTAGSWTSEGSWKNGTHFVVCTVRKQNGGTMGGGEP
ncbi:hypothetical protein M2271_000916 [Streptomyces sp. LBL]|nr:hypothetical protein [Streptomyces sp. LBL]